MPAMDKAEHDGEGDDDPGDADAARPCARHGLHDALQYVDTFFPTAIKSVSVAAM